MLSKIKTAGVISILFFACFFFISCEKKETGRQGLLNVSPDSAAKIDRHILLDYARKFIDPNLQDIEYGTFEKDSSKGFICGREIMDKNDWGIKLYYLKLISGKPNKIFETPLLKGSLNESLLKRIKLAGYDYEMFYYNSQDYFLGSGGGEIFSHLIDFNTKEIFSAHFFTIPDKPVSLYLSPSIKRNEIREFFIKNFQRDYPNLKLVSRDVDLDKEL